MTQTSALRRPWVLIAASAVVIAVIGMAVGILTTRHDAANASDACKKLGSGRAAVVLPNGSSSNSWRAEFEARSQDKDAPDFAVPVQITSPNGSVNDWQFLISEGRAHLNWENSSGSYTDILTSNAAVVDGRWHTFRADVAQAGADIAVTLTVDGITYGPSTLVGKTLDSSDSSVAINPLKENMADAVKHFTWQSSTACAKLG